MQKDILTIDLSDYVAPGVKTLNNRSWGIAVRNACKIDIEERTHKHIEILISSQINSINVIFLEEFLENVVHKLGKDEFFKKFSFKVEGQYTQEKIDYYVKRAVNNLTYANA